MSDAEPADAETVAADARQPPREISDPKTMRALAHPLRLAILDAMRSEGKLTATRAAELLNESPGNMSWHLQMLAKYGFIVEADGAKGRSRPWQIAPGSNRIKGSEAIPGSFDAVEQLVVTVLDRSFDQLQEWWRQRRNFGDAWANASFVHEQLTFLTPAELTEIREQIGQLVDQYDNRSDPTERPPEALPVHVVAFAHPMPRTKAGD